MVVAWGGIEPPTQGFSILDIFYLPLLIAIYIINKNQHFTNEKLFK